MSFRESDLNLIASDVEIIWSIAAAEVFLYGAYLIMFGFYVYILRGRQMKKQHFLTGSAISLFILGTVHCALVLASAVFETRAMTRSNVDGYTFHATMKKSLGFAASAVYVTNNIIADSIFIFRCYAIWNFRRTIVILPTILTVAGAGFGYYNVVSKFGWQIFSGFIISVVLSLCTNLALMVLTVGRIWWLAREARKVMGRKVADRYYTVCAMILESGALYLVSGVVVIVVAFHLPYSQSFDDISAAAEHMLCTGAILAQSGAIVPTIIAVRVGLGYSVQNVDSFIAPTPRTRPLPEFTPGVPKEDSTEQVFYINADGRNTEVV
ncbi:hypothetical protein B0H17DRAFT_1101361 [Mycena rosella]|uniref:Uncharacterized protein n=1 Tax=Mycena rosella TaxID=1033263 RepID=A0AAD7CM25_MYCRO|nr:hypothetical protein B0H17DRAFT_1101361 [Mycena rosella]